LIDHTTYMPHFSSHRHLCRNADELISTARAFRPQQCLAVAVYLLSLPATLRKAQSAGI